MAELEDAPWATPEKTDLPDAPWVAEKQSKDYALSEVPKAAASNVLPSAGQFVSNMAQPFIHPVDTVTNLNNLRMGLLEKLRRNTRESEVGEHEKYADALGHHFSEKYGGWENVKRTMAEDPVGFLADASMAFTGAGAGIRGAGKLAEAANLTKTADVAGAVGRGAQTAGTYTDPIGLVGKGLSKLADVGPETRMLKEAGVDMTPGQLMPGKAKAVKTLEDASSSIPGLGYFVQNARANSIKSFNEAVGRQALEPLAEIARNTPISTGGGTIPLGYFKPPEYFDVAKGSAGHKMVQEVEGKLGEAYDNLLPRIQMIPDAQWTNDIRGIINKVRASTPRSTARTFENIILDTIHGKTPVAGARLKEVESELSGLARTYTGSNLGSERIMGQQLNNVVRAIRSNLERVNPAHQQELAAINHGWAMYARIRDAAARRVKSEGVFTPSDLLQAIKTGDKTVRHGAFAKGEAMMQRFAQAGEKVLPSTVPDSGTATRLATQHLITGGTLGAGTAHFFSPEVAAALGTAAIPYTKPGMWAANKVARLNPAYIRPTLQTSYRLGQAKKEANPYAP